MTKELGKTEMRGSHGKVPPLGRVWWLCGALIRFHDPPSLSPTCLFCCTKSSTSQAGYINQKMISRIELTVIEAEFTETENFSSMFGLHLLKTKLDPVNSGLSLSYLNRPKTE